MAKKDLTPQIFLLDTNAIVQLLKGNEQLITVLSQADFIAVSVISCADNGERQLPYGDSELRGIDGPIVWLCS